MFGDLKRLQQNNLKHIKNKPFPWDPLKINQFSPQDKIVTKKKKERNKLLKNGVVYLLITKLCLKLWVRSLALNERGIKQAFKDYSLNDQNKKNKKTIVKEFLMIV